MPDFVINPEQVAAELQWPKHDPACWVFNTPTGPRRFLINPDPGTVAGIVERLSGLDDDDSPVAAAKARMSGWRDQMAEIVAADIDIITQPQKYLVGVRQCGQRCGDAVMHRRAGLLGGLEPLPVGVDLVGAAVAKGLEVICVPTSEATAAQASALGILGKGLAPVHRKAVANAKRLRRTKLK